MPAVTSDLLRRLPKAELHCHLDGSVRPSTLIELGRELKVQLPRDDAEALRDYMRVDDARNLEEYLSRFSITLSVMQTAEALERVAYELAEDCAREGVRYLEARYAPVLNVQGGLTVAEALQYPMRGLLRAQQEYGITSRVIVCALRNLPPTMSLELARLAVDWKDAGVVGFDLAGGEAGNPAAAHAAAFQHAVDHDLPCTCHAGEGDGADSVAQAIFKCHAHRIGHGTRMREDPALLDEARKRGIAIECCLTSNIQTRAAASFDTHPLRAYFDAGLEVSINTDNRLMSGTDLVTEYGLAARHLGFTFDELARVARTGFTNAFLPEPEKAALLERVDAEVAALRTAAA
ncbi:MAG TPA: adenosine deaminase [Gemmatimonadaceae bacterium]|nr:adenosine deaminase [Gemmatimonadaceae bacterium]